MADGYVYPPSLGNEPNDLQRIILGYGSSIDSSIPKYGRGIKWSTEGTPPFTIGGNVGYTERRPDLDNAATAWNYLDKPVPGLVASVPDNGCNNCGQ